ncbi:hypothetical protein LOC68_07035 [Blastopirellula sp. JC732]|uniref:Uncharacterized protein n=1 Tax=Blastopirellula sediminis TaxID=2894196 RepID=A0A9X1MKY7_9BACT|nr:hypothetical protein [Blastopirellula sediminis]MCC9609078.1 hypothetical protein [Blastopirellula sediminis]MCC9628145.1 hypothetical protein [Blastopirellula sediminis]
MSETRQNMLVGLMLLLVVGAAIFGYQVLGKLERVVGAAERTEAKLDRIIEATAPLGKAAVEKGTLVLENIDEKDMANSASVGIKEIGDAAKKKLTEIIQKVDADNDGVGVKIEVKDK